MNVSLAGNEANVNDTVSKSNIVATAVGSKDHTTLVAALKAADLVDVMANPGPFTVFAPTNAAFLALPKGTVENLLKPENKKDLINILQYHVFVGALQAKWLKNGQTLNQVNGSNATIKVDGKKISINGANVIASIKTTNGIIHVIDAVLLPPAKK
jgi:uncharacterized surface protein with fasciclin (FAS1) repeats